MHHTKKIRKWLKAVLGPTVPVSTWTKEKVHRVFRMQVDFYGSNVLNKWRPRPPKEIMK